MNRLSSPTSGPLVDPTGPSSSRRVDPLVDPREWTDRDSPDLVDPLVDRRGVRPVGFATVDTGGPTRWTDQLTRQWTHWWTHGGRPVPHWVDPLVDHG
jgi:hypothetical protein